MFPTGRSTGVASIGTIPSRQVVAMGLFCELGTGAIPGTPKDMACYGRCEIEKNQNQKALQCDCCGVEMQGARNEKERSAKGSCFGGGMHPREEIRQAENSDGRHQKKACSKNRKHYDEKVQHGMEK